MDGLYRPILITMLCAEDKIMKHKKTKILRARVTEEDYAEIIQVIQHSGLNESEFLRRAAKGAAISTNNAENQQMMAHICKIQSLLNDARLHEENPLIDEIQEEVSSLCQCLS